MTTVLDTRVVPPSDRPEYWSAGIAERFFPMQVEAVAGPSFEARLVSGQVGPIAVQFIQGLPHRVARTRAMIDAADPECILLYVLCSGAVRIEQDDRSCILRPGNIACHDTSRPSTFEGQVAFEVLVVSLPKWFIGARAESIAQRTATKVDGGEARLARLAAPFLVSLARAAADDGGLPIRDSEGAAEMLLPMLRSIYSEDEATVARSSSDALLTKMQRYACGHLHDPDLGPEQIAKAHFVSTRYVHKLFASSGTGVSAWIRERRLEGATEELRGSPGRTIAAVAERWGYRNAASFSRAFREMYGCAPRDVRRTPRAA